VSADIDVGAVEPKVIEIVSEQMGVDKSWTPSNWSWNLKMNLT